MKVFEIQADEKRYQMIGSAPGFVEKYCNDATDFRLLQNWEPMTVFVDNPRKPRGDFMRLLEYFVCPARTAQVFAQCIENDVELLPIRVDRDPEEHHLWNIVTYVDALDRKKSKYKYKNVKSVPVSWVFRAERLTRPMLFRDKFCPMILLVATGFEDTAHDFYLRYQQRKARGLRFNLVWESS